MNSPESRTWADMIAANPDHSRFYIDRFKAMEAEGRDLHGEARLIDAMASRGSLILDAGCGPGRVGGYLASLGHVVVGVDLDPVLIDEARRVFPESTWLVADLAELDLTGVVEPKSSDVTELETSGDSRRANFDVIVSTGNVLPFVEEGSRARVVSRLAGHLSSAGRLVVGFGEGRGYSFDQFFKDAEGAGLSVDMVASTWDLRPFGDDSDFVVAVFSPDSSAA